MITLDTKKYISRVISIGNLKVGGDYPVRLQSMTNVPTTDTISVVQQIKRLCDVGCEMVRVSTPTLEDAKNLKYIKQKCIEDNLYVPLIADIHFRNDIALIAAEYVDKVRINPGNYADSKLFRRISYTNKDYQQQLEKIENIFTPLVLKLKKNHKALRIGVNHGSLSDRIMNMYGDTPEGMVESALEFVRICEKNNFFNIILSMKASNVKVMLESYYLLVKKMIQNDMSYPLHLGVTESGSGEDGRIKSIIGIGGLLMDNIGDTIRVSLTEPPEQEIPVCQSIITSVQRYTFSQKYYLSTNEYCKTSFKIDLKKIAIGGKEIVYIAISSHLLHPSKWKLDKDNLNLTNPDIITVNIGDKKKSIHIISDDHMIIETNCILYSCQLNSNITDLQRVLKNLQHAGNPDVVLHLHLNLDPSDSVKNWYDKTTQFIHSLRAYNINNPICLELPQQGSDTNINLCIGLLVYRNFISMIHISDQYHDNVCFNHDNLKTRICTMYKVLQSVRNRQSRAEYISCPSCSRTLFDLEEVTSRIQKKTAHLKNIKIAIMGCIVNGLGEMADADFGYVGGSKGKINLYVGKKCVEKSIPSEIAESKLIQLIQKHGKWHEKF